MSTSGRKDSGTHWMICRDDGKVERKEAFRPREPLCESLRGSEIVTAVNDEAERMRVRCEHGSLQRHHLSGLGQHRTR